MKTIQIIMLLVLSMLFLISGCKTEAFETLVMQPADVRAFNTNHSQAKNLQAILDKYTSRGLPGAVVAIKDKEGVWEGTSGFAKIETNQLLTPGYIHAGGSITKIYTAVAVMKLREQNKIKLDTTIMAYLPASVVSHIHQAEKITVRMLLNHSSGIPDYIDNTNFRLHWYNNLSRGWTVAEALAYAYDASLLFEPGTKFSYSNNNYMLLSLMIAHVSEAEEAAWLKAHILEPLQLKKTYYKVQPDYLEGLAMPNYYLNRYGDGRLQNVTLPTMMEIYSELGDGGLVASAIDFVHFMESVVKGQIISAVAYQEMKTAHLEDYGLGIDTYRYKELVQYGHAGSVFGGAALMLYFEEQETIVFIASNVDGSLIGGKTLVLYHEMKNEIGEYIASQSR